MLMQNTLDLDTFHIQKPRWEIQGSMDSLL